MSETPTKKPAISIKGATLTKYQPKLIGPKEAQGPSVTIGNGLTAVVLDPPYDDGEMEYAIGGRGISSDVRAWGIKNGNHPKLRIALCGYDGEHPMPDGWLSANWTAQGGYGNQRRDEENPNRHRETIWFSPHCISPRQTTLFDQGGAA